MNRASPTPDDLDKVFAQYFKAQLPAKWPTAPIPVHTAPAVPARTGSWQTRLTLAASVAALLAIGFGLSYGPGTSNPSQPNGDYIGGSKANAEKLKEKMDKNDVPTDKQP